MEKEYMIFKTNYCEITFVDGEVREVYGFNHTGGVLFDAIATGNFRFELTNAPARNQEVLNKLFQHPYFNIEGFNVVMTEEGITCMRASMARRHKEIESIVDHKSYAESFFMCVDTKGNMTSYNTMPAMTLAKLIMLLTKKDPNFDKAFKEVIMEDALSTLHGLLQGGMRG